MFSTNAKALASTILAAFLFAIMALLVKILSTTVSPAEILFVRSASSILIMTFVLVFIFKKVKVRNFKIMVVRGLFGGLAVLLFFIAISRIPLSSAVMIGNSYPLFAVLFSSVLIKEKPRFDTLLVLMISFGGMFLILDPKFGQIDIGYLLAVLAAVFGGVAVTAIRVLRRTDSSWEIALAQMIGAALFSAVLLPASFSLPTLREWGFLLIVTLTGIGAQIAFTKPFKFIATAEASLVAPIYTAFVVMFSVMFLGECLSSRFVLGALLVFGGMIYLIAREEIRIKKNVL
ncbi:DMT family transporter [Candidatus Margulisiibacteriota bacterium]